MGPVSLFIFRSRIFFPHYTHVPALYSRIFASRTLSVFFPAFPHFQQHRKANRAQVSVRQLSWYVFRSENRMALYSKIVPM